LTIDLEFIPCLPNYNIVNISAGEVARCANSY